MIESVLLDADALDYGAFVRLQKEAFEALLAKQKASDAFMTPEYFEWKFRPPARSGRIAVVRDGERYLTEALASGSDRYDFVFLDCPPSLGPLTVNALAAADRVLVPVQAEYYALEGLSQLLHSVELIRRRLNPHLGIGGILLTMVDGRTRLAAQVEQEVRKHFGPLVFRTAVPRSVRLAEAPSYGLPAIAYDRRSAGADAYWKVAMELVERA